MAIALSSLKKKILRNQLITYIFVTNQLQISMRRDVFQAIADPVRRDILQLLAQESLTINSIADNFSISRPAISKHLKILRECGVVEMRKEGRVRYCDIQPTRLTEVSDWIEQYRRLWEAKLDSFESYLHTIQSTDHD